MTDRRTGNVGADVDLKRQAGSWTDNVQTAAVAADVDLKRATGSWTYDVQTGSIGVMVDGLYVGGPPVGTVRWSSSAHAFQLVGSDPAVMWSTADTFVTSGTFPFVIWNDTLNRFELPP